MSWFEDSEAASLGLITYILINRTIMTYQYRHSL